MASRLYWRGHTTKIEYIGGLRVPPGDIDGFVPLTDASEPVDPSVGESTLIDFESFDSRLGPEPSFESLGNTRVIGGRAIGVSARKDDAEDRCDWRVLFLEEAIDGSELADDIEGESLLISRGEP